VIDDDIYTNDVKVDEWYRVCSQGGVSDYPYGKTYDGTRCNFSNQMSAVNTYPGCVTPDGVLDLLGNVFEWENACDETASSDPQQVTCAHRGGSAFSGGDTCISKRNQVRSFTAPDLGFRCCSD
jgi:formylglycine-generating enzyme required for sulfatase activity